MTERREPRLVKAFQGERLVIKSDNNNVLGFRETARRTSPWDRSVLAPRVCTGACGEEPDGGRVNA